MHPRLTDIVVEKVQQRHSEGDCPVTPAYDVETLEFALLDLAGRLHATPAPNLTGLESARRCDTNLVGAGGECTACQADQGETCRSPALTGKERT